MIPSSGIIKKTAKNQLKNRWVTSMFLAAILVLTVSFITIFGSLMVTLLASGKGTLGIVGLSVHVCYAVFAFLTVVPLFQGALRWFWFMGLEKPPALSELFYYFSEKKLILKTIQFYLLLLGRSAIISALCLLPAGVTYVLPNVISEYFPKLEFYNLILQYSSKGLFIMGLALALILLTRYFTAPMLSVINEDMEPDQVLYAAGHLKTGKKNCLLLVASFIGWIFVSFLGIPLLYTLPYMMMSYAVAVRFAVTNHRYEMSRWGVPPLI